jgi:hypothetical protein
MSATSARKQNPGGRLILGLLLCVVALATAPSADFMRAVETAVVAAWTQTRDRTLDLVAQGRARLERTSPAAVATTAGTDVLLVGDYGPMDNRTRDLSGVVTFEGAALKIETGGVLKTRPDRIATGAEAYMEGATWAAAFDAPAGVQVEVRQVTGGVAPGLCAGATLGRLALVQTAETVAILPLRAGDGTPCPVLRLEKRR